MTESARNPEREAILQALYESYNAPPEQKPEKEAALETLLAPVAARTQSSLQEIRAALMKFAFPDYYKCKRKEEAIKGVHGLVSPPPEDVPKKSEPTSTGE